MCSGAYPALRAHKRKLFRALGIDFLPHEGAFVVSTAFPGRVVAVRLDHREAIGATVAIEIGHDHDGVVGVDDTAVDRSVTVQVEGVEVQVAGIDRSRRGPEGSGLDTPRIEPLRPSCPSMCPAVIRNVPLLPYWMVTYRFGNPYRTVRLSITRPRRSVVAEIAALWRTLHSRNDQ